MISVSQEWIDAQDLAIRPESNVYIRKTGYELSKNDLQSFRYSQNGKIDNSVIPVKEIYFSIFNDSGNFVEGDLVDVYFAFWINSAWEEINIGKFLISKVEKSANSFLTNFTLTSYFTKIGSTIKSLDELYIKGSNTPYNDEDKTINTLFSNLGGVIGSVPILYVNQGMKIMSYGEALQNAAICSCSTLLPKSNAGYFYTTKNVITSSLESSYVVSSFIQYNKPETTKDTEYSEVELTLTYMTNNFNIYVSINDFPTYDKAQITAPANTTYTMEYDGGTYRDIITDRQQGFWHCEDNVLYIENNTGSSIAVNLYMNRIVQDNRFAPRTFTASLQASEDNVLKINNDFICNCNDKNRDSDFQSLVNYIARCKQYNEIITTKCRIDPRVELFDKIRVEMPSGEKVQGIVEKVSISYNGAFNGEISIAKQKFLKPILISVQYSLQGWSFRISNLNPFEVDCYIGCSKGEESWTISADSTLYLSNNSEGTSYLDDSFHEKVLGELVDFVYCYFEDSYDRTTEITIILEDDN